MAVTAEEMAALGREAEETLQALGRKTLALVQPPPAPYAVFHHHSHAVQRLWQVQLVLERLFTGRALLTELADRELELERREGPPRNPVSDEYASLSQREVRATRLMELDLESLYLIGSILLDQWAQMVSYLGGCANPDRANYPKLVATMESPSPPPLLREVWSAHASRALWLFHHFRFYRNRFVAHVDRPVQRGSTRMTWGKDFRIHVPTPPGWVEDREVADALKTADVLAQRALGARRQSAGGREALEELFRRIGEISDPQSRNQVQELIELVGTTTPSFQELGFELLTFFRSATETLVASIDQHKGGINLGLPRSQAPRP